MSGRPKCLRPLEGQFCPPVCLSPTPRICTLPRLSESRLEGGCVIYKGQSEAVIYARYLYQGQSEAALSTGGQSEAALSTVTVCDLGLIWGHQHR